MDPRFQCQRVTIITLYSLNYQNLRVEHLLRRQAIKEGRLSFPSPRLAVYPLRRTSKAATADKLAKSARKVARAVKQAKPERKRATILTSTPAAPRVQRPSMPRLRYFDVLWKKLDV